MIIPTNQIEIKIDENDKFFNASMKKYTDGDIEIVHQPRIQTIGRKGGKAKMKDRENNPLSEEKRELYRYQARIRAGSTVRQLVKENNLKYMWTLTYKKEITARNTALDDFKNFMKRLSYTLDDKIPYVAVIEVQKQRYERTGLPILHFHMTVDRFIKHEILEKAWGHGYVYVSTYKTGKRIEGKKDIASYLSKYLKKDMEDNPELANRKMYLNSRGLKRPIKTHGIITENEKKKIQAIANNYDIDKEKGITGSTINVNNIMKNVSQEELEQCLI